MPETITKGAWARVAFGDVVQLSKERSKNTEADGLERFVGLEHLEPGDLKIRGWGNTADGTTFTNVFHPGHVLFGKRRAYQRKVAVAGFSGVCSGDIYVLEPKGDDLLPELLPFICQTDAFFDHAVGTSAGSLSPRTNWKSLATFEFALPPLEEQRRIAGGFQAVEQAVHKLIRARTEATKARTSYLFDLFSCEDPNAIVCGQLRVPAHWQPVRLPGLVVDAANALTAGPFGTIFKAKDFRESGVPIIQLRHLTEEGVVLDKLTFMDEGVYERLHRPYTVRPGDLVITKMGEPPGLAAIYPEDAPMGMVTPDVIKATLDESVVLPQFVVGLFNNPRSRVNLLQLCKGGTRTRVSLDELYSLKWPIPPLEEQAQIVRILTGFDGCIAAIDARVTILVEVSRTLSSNLAAGVKL